MKAVVYNKKSQDELILSEIEKQEPKKGEVLVKIYAVSINAADYRSMKMGLIPKHKIFGADIAGKVEAVGANAKRFRVGDEVFGDISGCGFGGFAQYVSVPETVLARKPINIDFDKTSALPMASVTALQALRNKGNIKSTDKVLICGAGGGVGTFAVQWAKYFGTEVTAVCSENSTKLIKDLGADYIINYEKQDFSKESRLYDLIIGVNGNYSMAAYRKVLAPNGRFVMVGGSLSQILRFMGSRLFMSIGSRKFYLLAAKPDAKDLDFVKKLIEEEKLKVVIDRTYPLEEIADAIKYISKGHAKGKVIIKVVNN